MAFADPHASMASATQLSRVASSTGKFVRRPGGPNFTGSDAGFLRLALTGALLQLVTLGFYRFWFITNIRRLLWSATSVDGDPLEYTGRGKELLIGFLFAVAILAPCYVLYFLAGLEVERLHAFGSLPLFLAFYIFGQFAIYRARRYRLTRTTWRGVRFWMTGSGVNFAFRSAGWTLLSIVTLGLALPWGLASLERYKMRNTYFGNLQGRFDGTGRGLFWVGAPAWGLGLLLIVLPLGVFIAIGRHMALARPDGTINMDHLTGGPGALFVYLWFTPLIAIVLWTLYKGIEWRWWLAGLRLGEIEFSSDFPVWNVCKLYFGFFLAFVGVAIGAVALFFVLWVLAGHPAQSVLLNALQIVLFWIVLPLYLVGILAVGALYRYFLQFRLWRAVVQSVTIRNLAAASNVVAEGQASNAIGEGLADSLDVVGF
jgi:uncharacterized membrane protein YjgN (DUF898 family)